MTVMARIKPRRRPPLRLVGADGGPPRHAGLMTLAGQDWVVEAWTLAEFDRLAECERPEPGNAILLCGLGFVAVRAPNSWMERDDVLSVAIQARQQWRDERGLD